MYGSLCDHGMSLLTSQRAPGFKLVRGEAELELTPKPRFLGLDVGAKRIGVAVSDELGITAQPDLTLETKRNPPQGLCSLARPARRFAVGSIVVGHPRAPSGAAGP